MSRPNNSARFVLAFATVALFVAPLALPLASAQLPALGGGPSRSVGTFQVAPIGGSPNEGRANGGITSAILNTAGASGDADTSVIKDFTITGGSDAPEKVFDSIDVKGFEPTSALEGVGTSALKMQSEDLLISMSDAADSLLTFQAVGNDAQQIVFNAAADTAISASDMAQNVWDVRGQGTSGVLILAHAAGNAAASGGSKLQLTGQHQATATLSKGSEIIYRANAKYGAGLSQAASEQVSQYNEAAVKAVANGHLASEATSEFSTGVSLIAQANFFASATAKTSTSEAKRVTTMLRSETQAQACAAADGAGNAAGSAASGAASAAGSAAATAQAQACAQILAYDLDYVDLPAATAENVAVYINGALAQRVDAASQVATHADSYWATTVEGRVLVLTNVEAQANAATQITLAAIADAQASASTLAQLDAMSEVTAQLEGGYQILGNLDTSVSGQGQVIGSFGAFMASEAKGAAEIRDFTDIRSATEIFAKMEFAADFAASASGEVTSTATASAAANAKAAASSETHAAARMVTSVDGHAVAETTFTDDIYAAFETTAEATTQADLTLSNDIGASFAGDAENALALDGPAGEVGHLILIKAEDGAHSASKFDLSVPGHVKTTLAQGDRLVYRADLQREAHAHADIVAQAIADKSLASEATVGVVANTIANTHVDWDKNVHLAFDQAAEHTHRGLVTLEAYTDTAAQAQAHAFAIVSDRATLAARGADDILVSIDGHLATAVDTAGEVYGSTSAAYYVLASAQGQTEILFNVPDMAAGEAHEIAIASTANAEAKAKSALDVFGSFEPGYGGVVDGNVVSLVGKPDAGLLLDYAVTAHQAAKGALESTSAASAALDQTTMVFDAIKIGDQAFQVGSGSTAHSLRYVSDQAIVESFDVSSATMKIEALANTVASLDLANNIQATPINDNVILLHAPDFAGALILSQTHSAAGQAAGSLSLSGDAVTAQLEQGSQLVFKAYSGFEAELSQADQVAQANAIASGELLGQVITDTSAGATALTTTTANINYFDDVKALTRVASSDQVSVLVDSASHAGKSIIISFDRDTVKGLIHGDAVLMVDGKPVKQASSYADAFNPDSDKYWLITSDGEVGLQAIVTLAHFSTREITIASPEHPSVFLWTTIALGLVVVGQFVYPRLKRRSS